MAAESLQKGLSFLINEPLQHLEALILKKELSKEDVSVFAKSIEQIVSPFFVSQKERDSLFDAQKIFQCIVSCQINEAEQVAARLNRVIQAVLLGDAQTYQFDSGIQEKIWRVVELTDLIGCSTILKENKIDNDAALKILETEPSKEWGSRLFCMFQINCLEKVSLDVILKLFELRRPYLPQAVPLLINFIGNLWEKSEKKDQLEKIIETLTEEYVSHSLQQEDFEREIATCSSVVEKALEDPNPDIETLKKSVEQLDEARFRLWMAYKKTVPGNERRGVATKLASTVHLITRAELLILGYDKSLFVFQVEGGNHREAVRKALDELSAIEESPLFFRLSNLSPSIASPSTIVKSNKKEETPRDCIFFALSSKHNRQVVHIAVFRRVNNAPGDPRVWGQVGKDSLLSLEDFMNQNGFLSTFGKQKDWWRDQNQDSIQKFLASYSTYVKQ